jgi:hypothetical protein
MRNIGEPPSVSGPFVPQASFSSLSMTTESPMRISAWATEPSAMSSCSSFSAPKAFL